MSAPVLKANFAVEAKHGAFYTGGKVEFSKDSAHIFCQFGDKVQILNAVTGIVLYSLGEDDDADVTTFALSPDQSNIVIANQAMMLKQWDWKDRTLTRSWKAIHTTPMSCMTYDCTSTLLATGGTDSTIKIWDTVRQYCTHNLKGHTGVISAVEFDPDIKKLLLVSAADDYIIRVWSLSSSECIVQFTGHYSVVTTLRILADDLYSAARDNVISVWNIAEKKKVKTIPVYETIEGMIVLPSDTHIPSLNINSGEVHAITGGNKGILKVWNMSKGTCIFPKNNQDEDQNKSAIVQVSYTKQKQQLNVVTFDHNILLYDLVSMDLRKQFAGYYDEVLDIKFAGKNDSHLVVVTNSELLKVFRVDNWHCTIVRGHKDIILCTDVCKKDPTIFATGSKDSTIRIWKIKQNNTVKNIAIAAGHTHHVLCLAFSRLSESFLVSGSQDLTMKMWSLEDMTEDTTRTLSARFTERAHQKDVNSVAISPNDRFVASASQDRSAKLWRVDDFKVTATMTGHKRGIWCVQFSPIDQIICTASADGTIKLWALSDATCVKTFEGHDASVLKITFLSRGMQILSTGSDGLMKLWTIKTNECVKTLDAHDQKIWALAVNHNEKIIVTGAADSNIIMWKDVTETEFDEKREKQQDTILKQQELSNLISQKKYLKALCLAISLDQPFTVLKLLKDIMKDGKCSRADLEEIIGNLRNDQIASLMSFAGKWNTNTKTSEIAQMVINMILCLRTPQELAKMPQISTIIEGLLPYTERHFKRMNKLIQQSTFIDYALAKMSQVSITEDINIALKEEPIDKLPSKEEDVNMKQITTPPPTVVKEFQTNVSEQIFMSNQERSLRILSMSNKELIHQIANNISQSQLKRKSTMIKKKKKTKRAKVIAVK